MPTALLCSLPLASDVNNDVRTATLRCCLNACAAGFDSLSRLRTGTDASAASVAKDPRVRLARAFCQSAWSPVVRARPGPKILPRRRPTSL